MAMHCNALHEAPQAISLQDVSEVIVERGSSRQITIEGATLRVPCPDRWMSQGHASLVRSSEGWLVEDGGSRNGTRLNGRPLSRSLAVDGDIVECGGTYFIVRRSAPAAQSAVLEGTETLQTLCRPLSVELSPLRKVARSKIPIIIVGESGTGKEVVAQAIHAMSGREGPFVAINFGALPDTLVDSELFGTTRGAFTGAIDRIGAFQNAHRGTMLLDEIGELAPSAQAALLHVLQHKELTPIGAFRPVSVDVRLITATNRNLHELVRRGSFRGDLYSRLKSYIVRLPPLRERREDLGLLVTRFIRRHDRRGGPRSLSRDAARALFMYDWPLNIRELEQCMAAALALAEGDEIGLEHFRSPLRDAGETPAPRQVSERREALLEAIRQNSGNMTAAARALGISRAHFYRLMRQQNIERDDLN